MVHTNKRWRGRGATLGLVVAVVLVVAVIGVGLFVLTKILGGGRELANATDAAVLNVAKAAIKNPSKDAFAFGNPDVGTNFAGLGDPGRTLNLLSYNRLVAQAALVALNAKEEATAPAATNARKVWQALNDVAAFLRTNHESDQQMGGYFDSLASRGNVKMLGNNGINLADYGVSYMRRGSSTNIAINPTVLNTVSSSSLIPLNTQGRTSPGGQRYFAGYTPFSVALPASGQTLVFCGVPVFPQDRPHLVRLGDFDAENKDDFVTGLSYPGSTLPPNAFKTSSASRESHSKGMAGAIAAAVVGSLDREYQMQIPLGYLEIKNGPSFGGPDQLAANKINDIFANQLFMPGIMIQGNGSGNQGTNGNNLFTVYHNLFYEWSDYNNGRTTTKPDVAFSQSRIFRVDGSTAQESDFETIGKNPSGMNTCFYSDYTDPMVKTDCLSLLDTFKTAYNMPGSKDTNGANYGPDGWTALEQVKMNVLSDRNDIRTCAAVRVPGGTGGVKWYDRNNTYGAPGSGRYNFAEVKSPYEYLQLIDTPGPGLTPSGCATTTTFDAIVKRCQQIIPTVTPDMVRTVLSSKKLELGGSLYVFALGGSLTLSLTPPSWAVPGTLPDGAIKTCGEPLRPIPRFVDAYTDGDFTSSPFAQEPNSLTCSDNAIWTPSSGYNNFLGRLEFQSSCAGSGKFCKPN